SGHPPASFVSSLSGQGRHRRYRAPRCVSRFRRTSPSVPAKARPRVRRWQWNRRAEASKQRQSVETTVRTPLPRRSTVVSAKCRRKTSRPRAVSVSHVVHALVDELVHAVGAELAAEARALGAAEGDLRALTGRGVDVRHADVEALSELRRPILVL